MDIKKPSISTNNKYKNKKVTKVALQINGKEMDFSQHSAERTDICIPPPQKKIEAWNGGSML
jgi:hypothetical protein